MSEFVLPRAICFDGDAMTNPLAPAPSRTIIRNAAWLVAWDAAAQSHVYRRDVDLMIRLRAALRVDFHGSSRSAYRPANSRLPRGRVKPMPASTALPLPDKPSIAVLPFQNMSGDPRQE